jgi:hypothetical protein
MERLASTRVAVSLRREKNPPPADTPLLTRVRLRASLVLCLLPVQCRHKETGRHAPAVVAEGDALLIKTYWSEFTVYYL